MNILYPIIERLNNINIRSSLGRQRGGNKIIIEESHAVELAKRIINALPPVMRALLDVLEVFDLDKWSKLKQLANTELAFKLGDSQISILGIRFTISITPSGYVVLMVTSRDNDKIDAIKRKLADLGLNEGIDYKVRYKDRRGKRTIELTIRHNTVMRINELKKNVLKKLCEMLNRSRREAIIKAILRLAQAPKEYVCIR